jgi:hypothetical protein
MKTPLVKAEILSIYVKNDTRIFLPERMAQCTPDMQRAIYAIKNGLEAVSGNLYLSDLFRSYDMQQQAYLDYKTGKKQAYSPPPGGSMHEAGRAFDLDLDSLKITLQDFWKIADKHGCKPIITSPDSSAKEAWHFDCRGSHQLVYEYYTDGKGTNLKPYEAMAISAILAIGIQVDKFSGKEKEAAIQSGLIRLGYEIGNIDGIIGFKTNQALETAGVSGSDMDSLLLGLENLLQQKFPDEYRVDLVTDSGENDPPPNVIR